MRVGDQLRINYADGWDDVVIIATDVSPSGYCDDEGEWEYYPELEFTVASRYKAFKQGGIPDASYYWADEDDVEKSKEKVLSLNDLLLIPQGEDGEPVADWETFWEEFRKHSVRTIVTGRTDPDSEDRTPNLGDTLKSADPEKKDAQSGGTNSDLPNPDKTDMTLSIRDAEDIPTWTGEIKLWDVIDDYGPVPVLVLDISTDGFGQSLLVDRNMLPHMIEQLQRIHDSVASPSGTGGNRG